jgi:hypothetical protein
MILNEERACCPLASAGADLLRQIGLNELSGASMRRPLVNTTAKPAGRLRFGRIYRHLHQVRVALVCAAAVNPAS